MKQTPASRRAAEELRAKLADVLLFQISDPRLELVTITDVESILDTAATVGSRSWIVHGWRPSSATIHPACPAM